MGESREIWKFTLKSPYHEVKTPKGSIFLSVVAQKDVPVAYFLVNTLEDVQESHWFLVLGTGHATSKEQFPHMTFVVTIVTHQEELVWHIFKEKS